jgi:fatty acid desaturase
VQAETGAIEQQQPSPIGSTHSEEFLELTRLVRQQGLLEKQPRYYAVNAAITLSALALGFIFLAFVDSLWLQLLDAVFLAVVFARIAFLGHDAGHRQIFRSNRWNDRAGVVIGFLLGMERTWWVEKHNRHHANPNQTGMDPDIDIPVLAFTEEDALSKGGFYRFIVRYQPWLFYPMLTLEGVFGLRLAGFLYLLNNKVKYPGVEQAVFAGHFVVYFGLLFYLLTPWHAVLFIAVHQLLFGLHMGSVFAPNHKGMPILDKDNEMDFLRQQVLTARNIKSNFLVDFMYGGLNYQIEHHLFPNMPRNKLGKVQKIVRPFCLDRSVPYHQTGVIRSQQEILSTLHRTSAPLRRSQARSS